MTPVHAAFVMEQTLGHVTHYHNLRDAVAGRADLVPTWLPIPFEPSGASRLMPVVGRNWSVRASWRASRALNTVLGAQPHDAVVFHTQVTSLFSCGVMRRLPSIISLDATPINYDTVGSHYNHRPAGRGLLDRQAFRLNQDAFQAAAGLVAWSEWAKHSLIDDYGVDARRVRVIAPGAAPGYFQIGEQRARSSSAENSTGAERPVRILFVGNDFGRKGGPLLLQCLRGDLAQRCEVHLVTRAEVAHQPNVYVHHGLGPNSAGLQQLFRDADIFVLPSLAECLAVVLMEATAAGLPVVTTDVGALREAVRPGDTGYLVPPGDQDALTQALQELVNDPLRRQRLGRAGHELAKEKFDSRRNNRALLDLVMELVEARRAQRRIA